MMGKEIELKKNWAFLIILVSLIGAMGWMLACAPPQYMVAPISPEKYAFSAERGSAAFSVPERNPAGSVKLTIAVVNPDYVEKMPTQYSLLARSFSNSLGSSLDEIIIAKGMTVKGPYENLEVIPYPDKKATNLTLSPRVAINFLGAREVGEKKTAFVTVRGKNILSDIIKYEMDVEGWISFEMREPLSAEKMWIKKLDLGKFTVNYEAAYRLNHGNRTSELIFDTRQDAVALSLNTMYPKILKTAWNYLNTDEMIALNKKGEEVRKLKRY